MAEPVRRHALRALGALALAAAALGAPPSRAAEASPDIAIVVARLNLATGTVDGALDITPGKGANFQPAFLRDGSGLLFVSDRGGSYNIQRHDFSSARTTALTNTTENLYSPTPLADGSGFSVIRVITPDPSYGAEAREAPVWRYGWDGRPIAAAVPTLRVGYHAWVGEQRMALFIVDDVADRNQHRAILVDRSSGKTTPLTDHPGRTLAATPDGRRATFVDQSDPAHWRVCAMGEGDTAPQALVELPPPTQDKDSTRATTFAWLPDGSMLTARGSQLLRWDGKPGGGFKPWTEVAGLGGSIRSIAVNGDGTRLAFSVLRTPAKP